MELLSKEEMEDKIRRHVTDGFQMDYDREDKLVPVFQKEEVVENIMIAFDEYAKQQSIAFNQWLGANYDFDEFQQSWGHFWEEEGNDGFNKIEITELYDLFEQSKK